MAALLAAQRTTRVSLGPAGAQGDGDSHFPALSADGRFVSFMSFSTNLVAGDVNGVADIFVPDLVSGSTILVSRSTSGEPADGFSERSSLSGDGRYVAFYSSGGNLVRGDTNASEDVFVCSSGKIRVR